MLLATFSLLQMGKYVKINIVIWSHCLGPYLLFTIQGLPNCVNDLKTLSSDISQATAVALPIFDAFYGGLSYLGLSI